MSVLWLIIKIILLVLLAAVLFIIFTLTIICMAPIKYEGHYEKYDEMYYRIEIRYLRWIYARFTLEKGLQNHEIKIFGKIIYKEVSEGSKGKGSEESKAKSQSDEQILKKEQERGEKEIEGVVGQVSQQATGDSAPKAEQISQKKVMTKEDKKSEKVIRSEHNESQKLNNKQKETSTEKHKETKKMDFDRIKVLFLNHTFYAVLKEAGHSMKHLLRYISPEEWYFELIIGREDPADTGELIAKLTLLYPWYYHHGIIRGDYEEEGLWGGILAKGKFRIIGILRILIALILNKATRKYIKLILKNR